MIEIPSTTTNKDEKTKIKSRKKSVSATHPKNAFSISLQNSIEFNIRGTIEELLTDLEDQEKRFLEKQSLYELNRYKAIVQKIIKTIVDEGFKTQTFKRSRDTKADFVIIKTINDKLTEISEKIVRSSGFNLLKTIEEIRGLIFDLIY